MHYILVKFYQHIFLILYLNIILCSVIKDIPVAGGYDKYRTSFEDSPYSGPAGHIIWDGNKDSDTILERDLSFITVFGTGTGKLHFANDKNDPFATYKRYLTIEPILLSEENDERISVDGKQVIFSHLAYKIVRNENNIRCFPMVGFAESQMKDGFSYPLNSFNPSPQSGILCRQAVIAADVFHPLQPTLVIARLSIGISLFHESGIILMKNEKSSYFEKTAVKKGVVSYSVSVVGWEPCKNCRTSNGFLTSGTKLNLRLILSGLKFGQSGVEGFGAGGQRKMMDVGNGHFIFPSHAWMPEFKKSKPMNANRKEYPDISRQDQESILNNPYLPRLGPLSVQGNYIPYGGYSVYGNDQNIQRVVGLSEPNLNSYNSYLPQNYRLLPPTFQHSNEIYPGVPVHYRPPTALPENQVIGDQLLNQRLGNSDNSWQPFFVSYGNDMPTTYYPRTLLSLLPTKSYLTLAWPFGGYLASPTGEEIQQSSKNVLPASVAMLGLSNNLPYLLNNQPEKGWKSLNYDRNYEFLYWDRRTGVKTEINIKLPLQDNSEQVQYTFFVNYSHSIHNKLSNTILLMLIIISLIFRTL